MTPAGFLIDVRDILDELGAVVTLDADIELPPVVLGTEEYTPLSPAHVSGIVTNTGAGIVVDATVFVELNAVCSRCLREFPLAVTGQVDAFFVHHGQEQGIPEEQEYGYIREGAVDILQAVSAALAIEIPLAPVHAEDCPGICPVCGADLAEGPCGCDAVRPPSPFDVLKQLLPGDDA
ncbi:MAG: DUF177 domain-containing protein [Coriobacteriia bacterium]|nr:DUF177 domain-containing protein [Coriobacteriia bacterium]